MSPLACYGRYCLVELLTALEHGVPLVLVELRTRGPAYDYDALTRYLADLEAALDESAKGLLAEHGYADLAEASRRLLALPKMIAKPFEPAASRGLLRGMLDDIVDALQVAVERQQPAAAASTC